MTYSKPSHALLIAPMVLWAWWRRHYTRGAMLAVVFLVSACGLYGVNAMISGDFNYQGGDVADYYKAVPSASPFQFDGDPRNAWDDPIASAEMSTNDLDTDNVLQDFTNRFTHNVEYFLVGRHFGFVPYFLSRCDRSGLLAAVERTAAAVARDAHVPGGRRLGGRAADLRAVHVVGRRGAARQSVFHERVRGARFSVTPPLGSSLPGLLAWAGGALFTAKMLMNPFVAAKFPNQTTERGFARRLPVEITMANDLPIMLEGARAHSWYSDVLLYFLDEHAYQPEVVDANGNKGVWIAGDGRADIVMRCEWPIDHLRITARSSVPTTFYVSIGGAQSYVWRCCRTSRSRSMCRPRASATLRSYAYLLSAQSSGAFTQRSS